MAMSIIVNHGATQLRLSVRRVVGQPSYNAAFDLDGDGVIGSLDEAAFQANMGKSV